MIYVPLKQVAIAIGKYGPHIREVIRIARTMAEKLDKDQNEDFSGRLNGLEDTVRSQSELNQQLIGQMELLKPVLDSVQKSLRMVYVIAISGCILSLLALALVLSKQIW
jgi:RNase adaptor protein for sRNA GlmZ degradation